MQRKPLSPAVAGLLSAAQRMVKEVDASAIDALIVSGGFDPELGARPMRRQVGRLVEAPLAAVVLEGELAPGAVVLLRGEGERVLLEPRPFLEAAE